MCDELIEYVVGDARTSLYEFDDNFLSIVSTDGCVEEAAHCLAVHFSLWLVDSMAGEGAFC